MFNYASPRVVVGHVVVLTEEGFESSIQWKIGLVAVSQVPLSNLTPRSKHIEEAQLVHQMRVVASFLQ